MVDPTKLSGTPVRTLSPSQGQNTGVKTSPQGSLKTPHTAKQSTAAKSAAKGAAQPKVRRRAPAKKSTNYSTTPFWAGMSLSILWVAVVAFIMTQAGTSQTFAGLPLVDWAIAISAIISPIAMVWMVAAYLQRAADVQSVTEPLRRQLAMITGESGAAEVRIRRFNQAIREQLELLRSTKDTSNNELMAILDRINDNRSDLENFEQNSLYQVKEVQDVIRRSMDHIEQLMEDKFTMLRILDNKLVQSGEDVSSKTQRVKEDISTLLEDVESNALLVATSVEQAMIDSKQLSETTRSQETSLIGAADTAAKTLTEISGKIDTNIAHFLSQAGMARGEAEQMAVAFDSQTRALDEFSNLLPSRITEAESVLRGVADRLYASEQLAREQATSLSDKLEEQAGNIEGLMDRFIDRVNTVDGGLQQRTTDLDGLVVRVAGASNDLAGQLDASIENLSHRADGALEKFVAANDEAQKSTDSISKQLSDTAARYEAATMQLSTVSDANREQLHSINIEMANQLSQFEALHTASKEAGHEVSAHAKHASQNMQLVLERLLASRDATQTIGENLTDKLHGAVDQNERVITRINEAARMTVHALGMATESLTTQEGDITKQAKDTESTLRTTMSLLQDQARGSEEAMRSQNDTLAAMLDDVRDRLDTTDRRLQEFADYATAPVQQVIDQIEESTNQGRETLGGYTGDMKDQLGHLQEFNTRIGSMGKDVSLMTESTLSSIESLNTRFSAVREAQEETARKAMDNFNNVALRLEQEVGSLGGKAAEATSLLKDAATKVGEQTYNMQSESESSGAKIQAVTTNLQNESVAMRELLERQTVQINEELTRAGTQFTDLGQSLKDKTDSAYALLDRVAEHYNEITRTATEEFESRATKMDLVATDATGKVKGLSTAMESQLAVISDGALRIESQAGQITATSGRTTEKLEELNAKLEVTQRSAVDGTDQAVGKIEAAVAKFKDQHEDLNKASHTSIELVEKAGNAWGSQASNMIDTTHQVEDSIRGLSTATTTFADEAKQIHTSMEAHNSSLIAGLKESIQQIDTTSSRLQKTAAEAIINADQANTRYDNLADNASTKLTDTTKSLMDVAEKTDTKLAALSSGITQQVAALNIVSEQITEQQKMLTDTSETHRTQLLELFGQLGDAHREASEVADRTIIRLEDNLSKVQTHLKDLNSNAGKSLDGITDATAGYAMQADMLVENAKKAEDQAHSAMAVTQSLQNQARELNVALNKETDRTGNLLTDLIGQLASGSGQMMDISSTANGALSDLQIGLSKQTNDINESMDQIALRQSTLTDALNSQRDTLSGLVTRLNTAQDDTAGAASRAAERLTEGTNQITAQIETLDTKATATLSTIHDAGEGFAKETAAIVDHTTTAEMQTQQLQDSASAMQQKVADVCDKLRGETNATSSSLEGVVGKLKDETSGLRTETEKAEAALSILSTSVTQQTTAISSNLETITSKQSELGSALDVQREMLGNMVTSLTLAQDETAAAAERTAARLTDSSTQISKQMEGMDTQTQDALAAIRSVSSGLSEEAARISEHTQNAENQVRDMLSSSKDMHSKAADVRELMKGEANQMIDQVGAAMSQLEETVMNMKTQSSKVTGTLDKSILDFSSVAQTASETLQKESDNLSAKSSKAKSDIDGINKKISESTTLIVDASEMTGTHGRGLMETAEQATTKLLGLISAMKDSDSDASTILQNATVRLTDTRTTLEKELQTIADLSSRAVEQVMGAGSTLAIQSDALRANLASSESALSQAADIVREESAQLPNILARSSEDIEKATKTFKSQTGEIADAMVKTTDRCIGTSGALRDTMMDEAKNLIRVADTADQTLNQFNEALKTQIETIKGGNNTLSAQQKQMVQDAQITIAQLTTSGETLTNLRADTEATASKLAKEFRTIEASADSTTKRLSGAGDNLTGQIEKLVDMTEKAEGSMLGASQNFREQLERVRGGVQTQIDDINRGLMQITAQLDRTGTSLRSALASTVVDVEKIAGRFDQTSKDTANQLTDRTARMRVATEEVAKLLNGFGDHIDSLMGRMDTAGEGIKRHETDLVSHMQNAFSHLGSVAERLNSTRALTESVSEAAVSKLGDVSTSLDKQMRHMAEGGQQVTEIIQSVSQTYADQVKKVSGGVSQSQEEISSLTTSIDDMQQRTDRMRVTLKLQGDELMGNLETILDQLSKTGGAISESVDGSLQQHAIDSLKKIS